MIAVAITLLAIGSTGVIAATVQEARTHEPKYKLMMKLFPWLFGVGGILLAITMAPAS